MIFRGIHRTGRGIITVFIVIALCIGVCLLLLGQNRIGLDENTDEFDLELLESWNRKAAYDTIHMYLSPKYELWAKENPSNIAKTIKYYINGYWTEDIEQIKDTLDKYEAIIRDAYGEALTLQFLNVQRANYYLRVGRWDEAKELAEKTVGIDVLEEVYPRLAADALGLASFIVFQYGELEKAIQYNTHADEILIANYGETFYGRITTLNNFSILSDQLGQHQKGLDYTKQTLRIVQEFYSKTHANHFIVLNTLGLKYQSLGQLNEAINVFEEAIQLNLEQDRDVNLFGLYLNLSSTYISKWDYENGEKYLSLAESILKDQPGDISRLEVEINLRRAGMLIDINREEEAPPYLEKIKHIIDEKYTGSEYYLSKVYALFHNYDISIGEYKSARENIEKYLSLLKLYGEETSNEWANGLAWKADVFLEKMEFDSAHYYMDAALETYFESLGNKHNYYLDVQLQKVKAYVEQRKYPEAENILNRILMLDIKEDLDLSTFTLPDYNELFKHVNLVKVLYKKIELIDKKANPQSIENLNQKAVYYDYLAKEFDRINAMYGGFKTRDDLFSESEQIFKEAIANAYDLYDLTKDPSWAEIAFQYSERTRSLHFQEIMREKLAKLEAGIPDSLRARELSLWTQKTNLQDQLMGTSLEDSLIYTTLSDNLLHATVAYEKFIKNLESDYPRYFDLKYNVQLANINEVRKFLLNKNKALIQYNIIDSFAYVHIISKKSLHFVRLAQPNDIDSTVNMYYQLMQNRDFVSVQELGKELHQNLFAPLEPYLKDIGELIIVPDSWLYYINLESLPLDNPRTPFLLNVYEMQYCYSPTVAVQIKRQPSMKKSDYKWVGFVPGFDKNSLEVNETKFAHQPWAMELADSVAAQFNGKLFEGNQANKDAFSENAGKGQILHVGTHAVANDQDPLNSYMILGSEKGQFEQLTAADIFNKRINSKCTVLTACETAVGQIKGGEGMVSLARSFSYAGSPNLVVTLWSVDDQQTARIIRSFYDYLDKDFTFDRALRMAKLDYLESARGELKHPFYWAGILYYGTDDQLQNSFWGLDTILLSSLALLGILFVSMVVWKRTRR